MLLHQAVERLADLAASYMAAGFVHGVLNTRQYERHRRELRLRPVALRCRAGTRASPPPISTMPGSMPSAASPRRSTGTSAQLAIALRRISEAEPLVAALERFGDCYSRGDGAAILLAAGRRQPRDSRHDSALVEAAERAHARERNSGRTRSSSRHRGGRDARAGAMAAALAGYRAGRATTIPIGRTQPRSRC